MKGVTITKKEWQFVFFFSIMIMILTTLPYLYGYLTAPQEKQFTGTHTINLFDTYWYISLIEQAREGNILFTYLSYPEFQQKIIFHPLFLIMGWFAGIFNMPNILTYHFFRVLLGIVFLWVSYVFISYFLKDILKRKMALIFLSIGSGFGWITVITGKFNQLPSADIWMKGINGFLTLYESPQNIMAAILVLIIFISFLSLIKYEKTKNAIICGAGILLLVLIHPYEIVTVILTLFLYFLYSIKSKNLSKKFLYGKLSIIFLFFLFGLAYIYYTITNSPILAMWAKEHAQISPPLLVYLSGFGFLAFFSFLAFYKIFKEKMDNLYLITIWTAVNFFLAYQPWINFLKNFQMEFLTELFIPVAILAAEGVYPFLNYLEKKFKKEMLEVAILIIILITFFSNATIVAFDIKNYRYKNWPFYLEKDYLNAFEWIRDNTNKNEVILFNNSDLAYFFPGTTSNPIFFSNWIFKNTAYNQKKYQKLIGFLKHKITKRQNINF